MEIWHLFYQMEKNDASQSQAMKNSNYLLFYDTTICPLELDFSTI